MNDRALYTAIFDNKDTAKLHTHINGEFDYVLFTDEQTFEAQKNRILASNWTHRVVPSKGSPRLQAKDIKINPHKWIPDYKQSIWVDASFQQIGDLDDFLSLSEKDFVAIKHPFKSCLYAEAAACVFQNKDNINTINRQVKKYIGEGYPKNNGLLMGGILLRKNKNSVSKLNNKWWKEINSGSIRDQISLPYVCWRLKYNNIEKIEYNAISSIFKNYPHNVR